MCVCVVTQFHCIPSCQPMTSSCDILQPPLPCVSVCLCFNFVCVCVCVCVYLRTILFTTLSLLKTEDVWILFLYVFKPSILAMCACIRSHCIIICARPTYLKPCSDSIDVPRAEFLIPLTDCVFVVCVCVFECMLCYNTIHPCSLHRWKSLWTSQSCYLALKQLCFSIA